MINSTFGGFMTARSGMFASQKALELTGHNLVNSSTNGYTRQRLDQVSLNIGGSYRYASKYSINIGNGALVTGTSQLRDPFLDKRYRNEVSRVGEQGQKLDILTQLEDILDEVKNGTDDPFGGGGIYNQLGNILDKLQQLTNKVGDKEFDTMVKTSCQSLIVLFNTYSKKIDEVQENLQGDLEKVDVPHINKILESIQELNKNIKRSEIHGESALELKDERNLLIDELAGYMKIDVHYKPVQVSDSIVVDELSISIPGKDGNPIYLINDKLRREVTLEENNGKYIVGLKELAVDPQNPDVAFASINETLVSGKLKGTLEMLNYSAEFDNPPSTIRGIGYFKGMMDSLAATFAGAMNEANKDGNGNEFPLFEAADGGTTITAGNISIAKGWLDNSYGITASKDPNAALGANDNILHFVTLFSTKMDYTTNGWPVGTNGSKLLFHGTFEEAFANIGNTLALDVQTTSDHLDNYSQLASTISEEREAVTGVSLDEEAMNIMRYQQSYNASARLMTALDEMLNTLITNTGLAGR